VFYKLCIRENNSETI